MARTKTLDVAVQKVEALPEAAQDRIGRDMLDYADQIVQLRADIQSGLDQLDAGLGKELDIEKFLRQCREKYDRR